MSDPMEPEMPENMEVEETPIEEEVMLSAGDVQTAPSVEEVVSPEKVTVENLVPVIKFIVGSMTPEQAANAKELFPILR